MKVIKELIIVANIYWFDKKDISVYYIFFQWFQKAKEMEPKWALKENDYDWEVASLNMNI